MIKPGMLPKIIIVAAALTAISPHCAQAREQIRVVGSSTVYPFITIAAEQFGQGGVFKTPIVESTGTGGGLKLFCEGVGVTKPDISNASRPITNGEKELCHKNGVTDIVEVRIGYDGIILANKKGAHPFDISKRELFMALARELPGKDGKLAPNPYTKWSEISAKLPDKGIEVYGPPPTSGTRDAFVELVMEEGCEAFPEFAKAYADAKERKKMCHLLREDGRYIDSGEDDNIIVQKLTANADAAGIMGFSFYEENSSKIQASKIDGVMPSFESIENESYGVSRSLFVYVKKQHVGVVPGIAEFIKEITSEAACGSDGYMTSKGLLPLKEEERKAMRTVAAQLRAKN